MAKYKIFAGLEGTFGGANFLYANDFSSEEQAMEVAYYEAISLYESYSESQGLPTREDIREENPDWTNAEVEEAYLEEVEDRVYYYVEETK